MKTKDILQGSEKTFREIAESINVVFWLESVNRDRFYYMSPGFERIWGISVEKLLENPRLWVESIVEEDREKLEAEMELKIKGKLPDKATHTYRIVRPDGSTRWIQSGTFSIYGEDGKVQRVAGMAEDITERKETEKALKASETRYRALVEGTDNLITVVDSGGRFTFVNRTAESVLGSNPNECIGLSAFDFIHPDDRSMTTEWFDDCLKNMKDVSKVENRQVNRLTGDVSQILWTCNFYYDDEGRVTEATSIGQDISERTIAENLLRISEERFRAIVVNAQAIIFIIARDGTFLLSEGKALASLGLKPGEVVGQSAYEIYADFPEITNAIEKTFEGETVTDIIDVGGIIFDIFYSPYTDSKGNNIGCIGMAIDITKRKRSEEALIRSEQMAAVGEIASGIAHELNNPLATISACTEVLLKGLDDDNGNESNRGGQLADYLNMIMDEVQHSSKILHDLLDFSRIRPVLISDVDLTELIETTVKLLKIQSRFENHLFVTSIADRLPMIPGDKNRLRQILIILLTNAAEAMPNGGQVTVSLQEDDANQNVELSISDKGTGISVENAEKIFQPYFTTKTAERGTGLGLSIARNIINQHNGSIDVTSIPNKGSTFTVLLPLVGQQDQSSG